MEQAPLVKAIYELDTQLARHFEDKFRVQPILTRQIVSFQDNKSKSSYRWYKYKEALFASLPTTSTLANSVNLLLR